MTRLILTPGEKNTPLWAKLVEHYGSRLEHLRETNDARKSDVDTADTRGRIAEVKEFLALDQDPPELDK